MEMLSDNENNLESIHTSFLWKLRIDFMLDISNYLIIAHERKGHEKLYFRFISI